jgi:hypothetical protein
MIDSDCGVHLMVHEVSLETQYGTAVKIKFDVLAASDPKQVGKSHTEIFNVDDKQVDKFYNVAEAVGLITSDQRRQAAEQGVGLEIDENLLKGRQLCGLIKMEIKQVKDLATGGFKPDPEKPGPFPRLGFRTFGVFDAKAKDIPKDQKILALLNGGGNQPAPRPPAPAPTSPLAAAPAMNW